MLSCPTQCKSWAAYITCVADCELCLSAQTFYCMSLARETIKSQRQEYGYYRYRFLMYHLKIEELEFRLS